MSTSLKLSSLHCRAKVPISRDHSTQSKEPAWKKQRCVSPDHFLLQKSSSQILTPRFKTEEYSSLSSAENDGLFSSAGAHQGCLSPEDFDRNEEDEIDAILDLFEDYELVSVSKQSKLRDKKRAEVALQEEKVCFSIIKILVHLVQSESRLRGSTANERLHLLNDTKKLLRTAVAGRAGLSLEQSLDRLQKALTAQDLFPPRFVEVPQSMDLATDGEVTPEKAPKELGKIAISFARSFQSYLAKESKSLCRQRRASLTKMAKPNATPEVSDELLLEEEVLKTRAQTIEAMHEIVFLWSHLLQNFEHSALQHEVAIGALGDRRYQENADSLLFDLAYFLSLADEKRT
uniref:Uncharacterized protein n=1 Tax=Grammatophora oceanica TaxID=210454 RepID=A0A7S1UZC8_9STRA